MARLSAVLIAAALCACASSALAREQRPFSDMFTQDTALDPGWVVAEPNPGSSYALKKGLVLDASALNGGSDLWPLTNYNASLLLQPMSSNLDFTVTTKVIFQVTNDYMGAGLVLTTQTSGFNSSSVFHRFEYGDNPQPGLESFTNGDRDPNYVAFTGKLVWLRLQKTQSTYTYSYSTDGKTFTQISTITDATPYTYIGLISVRQPYDGQTGVDARPVFKTFKIISSKE
jgi:regulation of enolase protein 1 (concanavalin A-like superfamily)